MIYEFHTNTINNINIIFLDLIVHYNMTCPKDIEKLKVSLKISKIIVILDKLIYIQCVLFTYNSGIMPHLHYSVLT